MLSQTLTDLLLIRFREVATPVLARSSFVVTGLSFRRHQMLGRPRYRTAYSLGLANPGRDGIPDTRERLFRTFAI